MSNDYKAEFYKDYKGFSQVEDYLLKIKPDNERAKVAAAIIFLCEKGGYLEEPYSKHVEGKIRELIVKRHRIFYAQVENKIIILLYAFYKNTKKAPPNFITRAQKYLDDYIRRSKHEKN